MLEMLGGHRSRLGSDMRRGHAGGLAARDTGLCGGRLSQLCAACLSVVWGEVAALRHVRVGT